MFCQTVPTPEEMGHCSSVYLTEVGDTQVVVFKHGGFHLQLYHFAISHLLPMCILQYYLLLHTVCVRSLCNVFLFIYLFFLFYFLCVPDEVAPTWTNFIK